MKASLERRILYEMKADVARYRISLELVADARVRQARRFDARAVELSRIVIGESRLSAHAH
jgi:hypothetical protein